MQKIFALIVSLFIAFSVLSVSAQSENVITEQQEITTLNIISVQPVGPRLIDVTFNEDIDIASVRVVVENQKTRENIRVTSYDYSEFGNTVVRVSLATDLETSTTYTLIVNSVISVNNNTIKDGIDAIRDFLTPAKFSEESIEFSAPTNNTAIIVDDDTTVSTETTATGMVVETLETTATGSLDADLLDSAELPSTGVGTQILVLMFLMVVVAVAITTRKKA